MKYSTDDKFTIVLNNYRASGDGEFYMIPKLKVIKEIQTNRIDLIIEYILKE
ncbi:hypothetical protein RI065_06200 [Mycoplasmatota bacterium zrk1]